MEMMPNTHPDDDLAAIAADLYDELQLATDGYLGLGTGARNALERYERWLREQQAAHPSGHPQQ